VRDSLWDRNGTGILPNSFEGQEAPPPERGTRIAGNTVRDSGSIPVPANSPLAGFVGLGIGIAGGLDNVVEGNSVTGSARFGIVLFPTLQKSGNVFASSGNEIRDNIVSGSGLADLALSSGSGTGNCFAGNEFGSSLPAGIDPTLPCGVAGTSKPRGDPTVGHELAIPIPKALDRLGKRPDYTTMPAPDPADGMPDAVPSGVRPFREASPPNKAPTVSAEPSGNPVMLAGVLVMVIAIVLAGTIVARLGIRRRRQTPPSV